MKLVKKEKKEAKRRAREEARNAKGNGGAAKKGDGSGGSKSTQHTALSSSHAPYAAKKAGGKTSGKKDFRPEYHPLQGDGKGWYLPGKGAHLFTDNPFL